MRNIKYKYIKYTFLEWKSVKEAKGHIDFFKLWHFWDKIDLFSEIVPNLNK